MSCTTQPITGQSPRVSSDRRLIPWVSALACRSSLTSFCGLQVSCILHVPPAAHAQIIPRRARKTLRAAAQGGAGAETPGNSLFANNPQFAAALQSVAARQGDEALYSAPPAVEPEECVACCPTFEAFGCSEFKSALVVQADHAT